MADFTLDFSDTGADGTTTYTDGTDSVDVTVSTPTNFGRSFSQSGDTLVSSSVREPTSALITFGEAVENISFEIYDVDAAANSWDDKITVIARDALGNIVPVNFSDLTANHSVTGNTVEAEGNVSPGVEGSGAPDTITVSIPGPIVSLEIIHDNGDDFFRTGVVHIGPIDFTSEAVVPCFTPGTLICTASGEVAVEDLKVGDRVITRDNGVQEIRWVGAKTLSQKKLADSKELRPVEILAGSLGNGLPERDMLLSPNHRVLIANEVTALYFEEREVLVSCKHLVSKEGVSRVSPDEVTYIHFMFDRHEIVLADGIWTESFQPGDYTLKAIDSAQRKELFEIFPELQDGDTAANYPAARKVLKKHDAVLIAGC